MKDWAVYVEDTEDWARTTFRVGVQFFRIAEVEKPDDEALPHCESMKRMFLVALQNMGVDIAQAKPR